MNKKKATEETVNAFIKAVYPEMTALATTFGSEESILKDATEKIAALKAQRDDTDGAYQALKKQVFDQQTTVEIQNKEITALKKTAT